MALNEDIEVARAEDEGVEQLCDKGDALCAAVTVNGEDKDAFRRGV